MLKMDAVREHCKIDAGDQDVLIKLYVDAAVEAAEKISQVRLRPGRVLDTIEAPYGRSFKLSAVPNGPVVARVRAGGAMNQFILTSSGRRVTMPFLLDCGIDSLDLEYATGPACIDDGTIVDANPMIELGILKFVAHAYMSRGDDPNCWASDSGAAQLWRAFKPINFG